MKPPRRILNQPVVLLVEDEFLVRQTLADILREAEFWVLEAQDADEAFELLRSRSNVAAVLTDVNMPGSMDGFEFVRLVRQGWPVVGVIVISGQSKSGRSAVPCDFPSQAVSPGRPDQGSSGRHGDRLTGGTTDPNTLACPYWGPSRQSWSGLSGN